MIFRAFRRTASPTVSIFLHVPKTGGTALTAMLAPQFGYRRHYRVRRYEQADVVADIRALPIRHQQRIRLVSGHMEFGVHEAFPARCTYFTMMREPVDRIISHYYYAASTPAHYMHRRIRDERLSLQAYVELPEMLEVNNGQARLFAAMARADRCPVGGDETELFDRARHHLEASFQVVGLQERFDESVDLLCGHFGWKRPRSRRAMVTRSRIGPADLAAPVRAAIVDRNRTDLAIYAWVKARFERALAV